jgi:hypothetical protein
MSGRTARRPFVFDMREPERQKAVRAVLAFLKSEALHTADFTIREDSTIHRPTKRFGHQRDGPIYATD